MAELDINAVNEQRIKLGLKPIPVPGATDTPTFKDATSDASSDEEPASTLETREAAAHDNWAKLQAERRAKKEREARKQAAKKAREKEQRHKVLKGRTFSDDEEEDLGTQAWLAQQNKRQKKIAATEAAKKAEEAKRKELQYTSRDLKGLKVSHQLNEFDIDTEQILTLKDRNVGEESDEDELENAEILAKEKLQEKLELKKRKPVYNPLDDDSTSERKILAQYDEVIDGKKRHQFTLDGKGSTVEQSKLPAIDMKEKIDRILVELDDIPKKEPASDYKKEKKSSEIKFKKRSKNPNTVFKKKTDEDSLLTPEEQANLDRLRAEKRTENGNDSMEVDSANPNGTAPTSKKRRFAEMVFDDDDLQRRLAAQRREESKNRKKWAPGEFAKYLRSTATDKSEAAKGGYSTDPIVSVNIINVAPDSLPAKETADLSTQQWLDTLDPEKYWEEERKILQAKQAEATEMERLKNVLGKHDEGDADMFASDEEMGERDDEEKEKDDEAAKNKGHTVTDDVDIGQGLGSTLKMLKDRNLLDATVPKVDVKDVLARNQFLAEQRRRRALAEAQAQLERERQRERADFKKLSKKDQEEYNARQNVRREEEEAARMAELFDKNYKPNVQLKYLDEFNREMTPKEAFKELSHQFHGKGSGAGKREKKLKKIDEERRAAQRSTLDMSKYANAGRSDADERGAGFSLGN